MKKILTVLIPVYNTEKYIKRCLDSLIDESIIDNIEILIVSDGSKDNSITIARDYEKKYPNSIKIIEKENGGHGSTINKGLEIATGKYFRVLDSDDWFNTSDFVKLVNYLKNDDSDLVVTNYSQEHVYKGASIYLEYKNLVDNKIYDFDKIDLSILNGEYFVMATSTYKTELLRKAKLHLFEKTFYVDMQFNVIGFSLVKTFKYYDLDIYRYFIGRKDQSNNFASLVKNQENHEKVMKCLVDYYCENIDNFSDNRKKYYSLIIYYMLYTHYSIYCLYDSDHSRAYNKVINFDKYLKNKSLDLYNRSNISFIKANRKTNFVFVKINGKFFNKLISLANLFRR